MAVFSLNAPDLDFDQCFSNHQRPQAWPFSFEINGDLWEHSKDEILSLPQQQLIEGLVNPLEESSLSSLSQLSDEQFQEFLKSSLEYFIGLADKGLKYIVLKASFKDDITHTHHDVQSRIVLFFNYILEHEKRLNYYFPVSLNTLEHSPELCKGILYLYQLISSPRIKFRLTIPFPYDLSR